MSHFKKFLPILILIPTCLYIVAFIFQFANGDHIIKEYMITVGNYNTKIHYFEFWNREGTGYINNLTYVFDKFITSIKEIFTEVPIIKRFEELDITDPTQLLQRLVWALALTYNILACIINILIFLPFKILWGIILLLFGVLGINFTNQNNVPIFAFLWVLSELQIPYIQY